MLLAPLQIASDDAAFAGFWDLLAAFRARPDAANAFTFCLPWEYAALCAALWRANAAIAAAVPPAAAAPGGGWWPTPCYPVNAYGRQQMSAALWDSLAAGPDDLLAAYQQAPAPRPAGRLFAQLCEAGAEKTGKVEV